MSTTVGIRFDDPTFQQDPWPLYERYREHEPVHYSPDLGCWFVFGYDLVRQVLVAPAFSAYHPFRTSRRAFGPSMLDSDGPRHAGQRAPVAAPFKPREVARTAEEVVAPIVAGLLDELVARRDPGFAGEIARRLPMLVVCRVMGLPEADAPWLLDTMRPLARYVDNDEVSLAEVVDRRQALRGYLRRALDAGTAGPGVLHLLADDGALSEADAVNNAILLLAAGTETTAAAVTNLVARVAAEPGLYERLRADRSLVPDVVAETLRHEPPLHLTLRFAAADVELAGVTIPAGAPIQAMLASANRDPAVFERPHEWDPGRPRRTPLTFGAGRHVCLGMNLANAELEIVLGALLDRVAHLRVADGVDLRPRGRTFRGVAGLRCELVVEDR